MKSLSHIILERKRAKFTDEIRPAAVSWMAKDPFCAFVHKPTAEQAIDMILASKFGPGDPLSKGGNQFMLEYLLDELDGGIADIRQKQSDGRLVVIDPHGTVNRVRMTQSEPWGNLVFVFDVDTKIITHWARMGVADFEVISHDGILDHAIERESRAFGLRLDVDVMVPISEVPTRTEVPFPDEINFSQLFRPTPTKANDKCSIYWMTVGPMDRLLTPEERARHNVRSFDRKTPSGGITTIRAHERRNPRSLCDRTENLDEVRHVVYHAYDAEGLLRYIGEGLTDRPEHVNSGCSHNYKLNEHYFLRGPMRVEVIARDLSKDESLTIERLHIRGHRGPELWNIKDYDRPIAANLNHIQAEAA